MNLLEKVHAVLPSIGNGQVLDQRVVVFLDTPLFEIVSELEIPPFWPRGPVHHVKDDDTQEKG
jgi:hypothetical protein